MMRPALRLLLVAILVVLTSACTSQPSEKRTAPSPPPPSPSAAAPALTQSSGGMQITLLGLQRQKEWSLFEGAPPMLRAKEGRDIVVVRLKVKSVEAGKSIEYARLALEDAGGKKYKCDIQGSDICGSGVQGSEETCGVPIGAPEKAQLKKLWYGDVSFDLEKLN